LRRVACAFGLAGTGDFQGLTPVWEVLPVFFGEKLPRRSHIQRTGRKETLLDYLKAL